MRNDLTNYAHKLQGQPMFHLLDRVRQLEQDGQDIIHFEIGDPEFKTPPCFLEACTKALNEDYTHYTSSYGLTSLREVIAQYTLNDLGFKPAIDQIVVSPGSNVLIYAIIQCLIKSGEEVMITDPAFPTYQSVMDLLDVKINRIPLREENGFRLDPQDISERISTKTKLIIINSPQNPTGAIIPEEDLQAIYTIAQKNNAYILSDDVYRLLSYDTKPSSIAVYDQCKERVLAINSFSKAFAMAGWRLGFMIGPKLVVDKVSLLMQTTISCVPSFIQKAVADVLKEESPESLTIKDGLKVRRDMIINQLNQIPEISCEKPEGAFYVYVNIKKTGMNSHEFANFMLDKAGVALLPGTNFGIYGEGYVRICYCTSMDNINEGVRRMKEALAKHLCYESL